MKGVVESGSFDHGGQCRHFVSENVFQGFQLTGRAAIKQRDQTK